jgi:hypothetical protein
MTPRLLLASVILSFIPFTTNAQINDSIPSFRSLTIDSVLLMHMAPDQAQVANLFNGTLYSTLINSQKKLKRTKSNKLIKYLSSPASYILLEEMNSSITQACCFYSEGKIALLMLYNVNSGYAQFGCYTQVPGFPKTISASSPYFFEYKLSPGADKKFKRLF